MPGYIETDMIASQSTPLFPCPLSPFLLKYSCIVDMSRDSLEKQIPLGRLGTSDEVADAASFLAQNPYANNCILNLDGGLSAV